MIWVRPSVIIAAALVASFPGIGALAHAEPAEPMVALVDYEALAEEIIASADAQPDLAKVSRIIEREPDWVAANAWVDADSGRLTVGVADAQHLQRLVATLDEQGIDAVAEKVERSQAELDWIVEEVYDLPGMETISSAMHDYARNRVVLTSEVPVTASLRQAAFANFGESVAIASMPSRRAVAGRNNDTSPFYAGAWIGRFGIASSAFCTLGWSWVRPNGDARMLTAGHCVPQGTNGLYATAATHPYSYVVGERAASTWENGTGTVGTDGDLAILNLEVHNRSGAPRMWTQRSNSTTSTTVNSVDFWTSNGQAVCYSGMKQGVQCGSNDSDGNGGYEVVDYNASYDVSGTDEHVSHVALAHKGWGRCVIPGDSGSPVYINTAGTGVAAHGILSGSNNDGGYDYYVGRTEIGEYCAMYFTEIGQAYHRWEGHLETTFG